MEEALEEIKELRKDFQAHVKEDREAISEIQSQLQNWAGQLTVIKWLSGAILAAIIAYGTKHW